MTPIESLPAKWRDDIAALRGVSQLADAEAEGREACTNELAAALAAQLKDETPDEARQDGYELGLMAQPKDGELLALADRMDEAATLGQNKGGSVSWKSVRDFAHDLRTRASRRVVVDDEMVERACIASSLTPWDDPKWDKDGRRDKFRAAMRQALTAALQPDSGEG